MRHRFLYFVFVCFFVNNTFAQDSSSDVVCLMSQKNYTSINGHGVNVNSLQTANGVVVTGDIHALGSAWGKSLPNPEDNAS